MKKMHLILTLSLAAGANLLLLAPLPHELRAILVLLLAGFLPGWLLVEALTGRSASPPDLWERILYSAGAGFTFIVITTLLLSYLPGGPSQWQALLAADALIAALLVWLMVRPAQHNGGATPAWSFDADRRWLLAGALALLVTASLVRFVNLGYADFQGDEARAALRAAAVLQGSEDVLMLHKKGPTEILIPTALYTLTGHLTESTARLPFALANVIALFAVWYLGWRLFHPLAGWLAAMFLALDGYFIGFARIVQYQSVVFLMTILAVLLLYRLVRRPQAMTAYLSLAALFMATGILSHYEGALAAIPAAYLWAVLLWRNRSAWRQIMVATVVAAAVGGALLAAFYVPYIVNPRFSATLYYLTDRRIGGSPPYNNLADVFLRTTLYSTTYYVLLAIGLTVAGMLRIYW
ncbi:MAG: glycosyltransferase family 39 protein, partial [Caldilineaceae bacterium]|nr:glycosyltransferase family 39 protein [Caldilineaceae bacterium]